MALYRERRRQRQTASDRQTIRNRQTERQRDWAKTRITRVLRVGAHYLALGCRCAMGQSFVQAGFHVNRYIANTIVAMTTTDFQNGWQPQNSSVSEVRLSNHVNFRLPTICKTPFENWIIIRIFDAVYNRLKTFLFTVLESGAPLSSREPERGAIEILESINERVLMNWTSLNKTFTGAGVVSFNSATWNI